MSCMHCLWYRGSLAQKQSCTSFLHSWFWRNSGVYGGGLAGGADDALVVYMSVWGIGWWSNCWFLCCAIGCRKLWLLVCEIAFGRSVGRCVWGARKSGCSIESSGMLIGFVSLLIPCWYSRKVLRAGTFPRSMFLLSNSDALILACLFNQHWLEIHVSRISIIFGHLRNVQMHTKIQIATRRQAAVIARL